MKKHTTALLLTAILGLASAQTSSNTLEINDSALANQAITIETGRYKGSLSSMLSAIATAAGYQLVLEVNVDTLAANADRPVAYSFRDKPFNQVWPLLMDVYGLNYTVTNLGGQPVIRVSNAAVQRVVNLNAADPTYAVERARVFFGREAGTPAAANTTNPPTGTPAAAAASAAPRYVFDSPTLRVVADAAGNRVIIRGTNKEVNEVEAFIRELDSSATARRRAAEAKYGTSGATKREMYAANNNAAELSTFISTQFPTLRVVVTPGSRGLVIEGEANAVDQAMSMLATVDPAAGATVQQVFKLSQANAATLKKVLTDTLARQLTSGAVAKNGNSANGNTANNTVNNNNATNANVTGAALEQATRLAAQEATIIADVRTNTLIVRGTSAQVAQIAALIPALDRRMEQVQLHVRIQEITNLASRSLGIDWKVQGGQFSIATIGQVVRAVFDPTQSVVGFNIFPALEALESQEKARRVYDGTVNMESGQVGLTGSSLDAGAPVATVRQGGNFYVTYGSGDKVVEKTLPYGVTLDFFEPLVSNDGTISVRVRGQFNPLNQEQIRSVNTPTLINIPGNEVQSRLSFKSGETVVLGGLVKEESTSSSRGLPFLSMIPGLGALAGKQASGKDAAQLIVVVTGEVVK